MKGKEQLDREQEVVDLVRRTQYAEAINLLNDMNFQYCQEWCKQCMCYGPCTGDDCEVNRHANFSQR